jgi:MFS family permease
MVQQMPKRRAYALGVHLTGGMMAEVIIPVAVGVLLTVMDWHTVLRLSVVPAVLFGITFLWLQRKVPQGRGPILSRNDLRALVRVWFRPRGIGLFVMMAMYSVSYIGLLAMTPLFLQEHHGYSSVASGAVFAVMLLGGAVAAPLLGRLADRASRKQVIILSLALGAMGCGIAAFTSTGVVMIAGLTLGASVLTGVRPVLLATAIEISGQRETTTLGFIYTAMDGVGALGAVLAGLSGSVDLRYAIAFASATAASTTLLAWFLPVAPSLTTQQSPTGTVG